MKDKGRELSLEKANADILKSKTQEAKYKAKKTRSSDAKEAKHKGAAVSAKILAGRDQLQIDEKWIADQVHPQKPLPIRVLGKHKKKHAPHHDRSSIKAKDEVKQKSSMIVANMKKTITRIKQDQSLAHKAAEQATAAKRAIAAATGIKTPPATPSPKQAKQVAGAPAPKPGPQPAGGKKKLPSEINAKEKVQKNMVRQKVAKIVKKHAQVLKKKQTKALDKAAKASQKAEKKAAGAKKKQKKMAKKMKSKVKKKLGPNVSKKDAKKKITKAKGKAKSIAAAKAKHADKKATKAKKAVQKVKKVADMTKELTSKAEEKAHIAKKEKRSAVNKYNKEKIISTPAESK